MSDTTFKTRFKALTGHEPFPWQIELFEKWFVKGEFPLSCNLPTGLGKTSIVAIWLIALMNQPEKIPRRLVYVVNRRTVVDQTTDEVEKLRENLSKLKNVPDHVRQLAISTLRGQFADNREWSADPSSPGGDLWHRGHDRKPTALQRLRGRFQGKATARRVSRTGCIARA